MSSGDPQGDAVSPIPPHAQCTHPTTRLNFGATWASGPPSGREKAWGTLEMGQRGSEMISRAGAGFCPELPPDPCLDAAAKV